LNFNTFDFKNIFNYIKNKYFILGIPFIIWMLFIDSNSLLFHNELDEELQKLEDKKKYYQKEIIKDEAKIKELEDSAGLEKFARMKYFMKKENEDVYIIEFKTEDEKE